MLWCFVANCWSLPVQKRYYLSPLLVNSHEIQQPSLRCLRTRRSTWCSVLVAWTLTGGHPQQQSVLVDDKKHTLHVCLLFLLLISIFRVFFKWFTSCIYNYIYIYLNISFFFFSGIKMNRIESKYFHIQTLGSSHGSSFFWVLVNIPMAKWCE